ncbi:hypothetical protein V6N12_058934 [Hibiscus sabdariffa]|uniref:Uncharacterized protein n=1 Tax=Hibiscus sabdariffa TaxID=183260 RepID=A0ABR2EU19_9ROSI
MLESGGAKGVLYIRQSLLILKLNCPDAAMRSLELAHEHASSEHERLVYEGWILYDTGHFLFSQALNNLGSVFVDCGKLDSAADCYINALKVRHTRAHQGIACVHFLNNDKAAAYVEMSKLIEKAKNNASAYEKRSEYYDRDLTKADLEMVTRLDPLRVYPYMYRAAVVNG